MRERTPRVRVRVYRYGGHSGMSPELQVTKVRGRGVYNNKNDMGILMTRVMPTRSPYWDVWMADVPIGMKINIEHMLGLMTEHEHLNVLEAYV